MTLRRTLLPGLLSLLLLLTQQLGFAHALSHLSDNGPQSSHGKQLPVEQACQQCQAFAQLGSAATTCPFLPLATALSYPAPTAVGATSSAAATIVAFRSRAPPVSS